MRHRKRGRKLGRSPKHQRALLRSLASALFLTERDAELDDNAPKVKGRIITTVAKAKEVDADIVGISALLTTTMAGQKAVIEALDRNGLRPRVKAIIGGAAVTQKWAAEIGADGYSRNAIDALELAKNLMSKVMNKGTA